MAMKQRQRKLEAHRSQWKAEKAAFQQQSLLAQASGGHKRKGHGLSAQELDRRKNDLKSSSALLNAEAEILNHDIDELRTMKQAVEERELLIERLERMLDKMKVKDTHEKHVPAAASRWVRGAVDDSVATDQMALQRLMKELQDNTSVFDTPMRKPAVTTKPRTTVVENSSNESSSSENFFVFSNPRKTIHKHTSSPLMHGHGGYMYPHPPPHMPMYSQGYHGAYGPHTMHPYYVSSAPPMVSWPYSMPPTTSSWTTSTAPTSTGVPPTFNNTTSVGTSKSAVPDSRVRDSMQSLYEKFKAIDRQHQPPPYPSERHDQEQLKQMLKDRQHANMICEDHTKYVLTERHITNLLIGVHHRRWLYSLQKQMGTMAHQAKPTGKKDENEKKSSQAIFNHTLQTMIKQL